MSKVLIDRPDVSTFLGNLPEETKQVVRSTLALSEIIAGQSQALETVVENSKQLKEYFLDVNGGNSKAVSDIFDGMTEEHKITRQYVDDMSKDIISFKEAILKKIDDSINSIVIRITVLLLSASAILGFIVYLIEKALITSSTESIVNQVMKNLGK